MRHKCFISFKTEDAAYKRYIQTDLNVDMIDKSLNTPINSYDEEYIMQPEFPEFITREGQRLTPRIIPSASS